MSGDSIGRALEFPRTERLLRLFLYGGSIGGIVLIVAVVLGLLRVQAPGVAVALFATGGGLMMLLLLFWRGQHRIRLLRRVAETNPGALHERVQQMQKVDFRWLATGAVAGLVLAAATVAFTVVLLHG
jgi:hypothetical protein